MKSNAIYMIILNRVTALAGFVGKFFYQLKDINKYSKGSNYKKNTTYKVISGFVIALVVLYLLWPTTSDSDGNKNSMPEQIADYYLDVMLPSASVLKAERDVLDNFNKKYKAIVREEIVKYESIEFEPEDVLKYCMPKEPNKVKYLKQRIEFYKAQGMDTSRISVAAYKDMEMKELLEKGYRNYKTLVRSDALLEREIRDRKFIDLYGYMKMTKEQALELAQARVGNPSQEMIDSFQKRTTKLDYYTSTDKTPGIRQYRYMMVRDSVIRKVKLLAKNEAAKKKEKQLVKHDPLPIIESSYEPYIGTEPGGPSVGGAIGHNIGQAINAAKAARHNQKAFNEKLKMARQRYRDCDGNCKEKEQIEAEFDRLLFANDLSIATEIITYDTYGGSNAFELGPVEQLMGKVLGPREGIAPGCGTTHSRWRTCLKEQGFPLRNPGGAFQACEELYVIHKKCRDAYEYYRLPSVTEVLAKPDAPAIGAPLKSEKAVEIELSGKWTKWWFQRLGNRSFLHYQELVDTDQKFLQCSYQTDLKSSPLDDGVRTITFWYEQVPNTRDQLRNLSPKNYFLEIPEIAMDACPGGLENAIAVVRKYSK